KKTPSRVRIRPPPPGTFRISPCGVQRTALRNGFNLVASRTRCDENATRAAPTEQEVASGKFAKSGRFRAHARRVFAHRLAPRPCRSERKAQGSARGRCADARSAC